MDGSDPAGDLRTYPRRGPWRGIGVAEEVPMAQSEPGPAWVDLYWLPLGVGDASRCVRTNGRIFEAVTAARGYRARCDLYHSALEVQLSDDRFVIEMVPRFPKLGSRAGTTPARPGSLLPTGHLGTRRDGGR